MNVQSLTVSHFRNLTDLTLEPSDGVNVIYGENAQGKTNLIESIWMFTGLRSFRGSREKELLQFGEDRATLSMHFFNDVRKQNAQITISDKKQVTLGGVKLSSGTEMAGEFLATGFSPGPLDLIQGGPSERRKFLNQALCQLKPNYAKRLSDFNRILQPGETTPLLFSQVEIVGSKVDQTHIGSALHLTVNAYAVQSENNPADLPWEASGWPAE